MTQPRGLSGVSPKNNNHEKNLFLPDAKSTNDYQPQVPRPAIRDIILA